MKVFKNLWKGVSLCLNFMDFNPFYSLDLFRSTCPDVFSEKGVLENFAKFTG